MSPDVSIVMAAFNMEAYIDAAIASVMAQTHKSWELIVVDDGSRDSTFYKASSAAREDSRIKALRIAHRGLSAARNAGIEAASGWYVTFLDADDLLRADALSAMLSGAVRNEAEIVSTVMARFSGDVPSGRRIKRGSEECVDCERAVRDALHQRHGFDGAVCGKLFERGLWEEIRFREGSLYEDLDVFYKVFLKARKVVKIPERIYFYRQRSGSILHTFNKERRGVLNVVGRIEEYMSERGGSLLSAARDRRFSACCNLLIEMYRSGNVDAEAEKECRLQIKRLRGGVLMGQGVRLKNRAGALVSYFFV